MVSVPASTIVAAGTDYTPVTAPPLARLKGKEIKVGKTVIPKEESGGKEMEVFTMTLGQETIPLLPLRNWGQLDTYKWCVRGKLPGIPAGLEIAFDHIRIAGETVSPKDPDACQRLERVFNEWLALEKATVEQAGSRSRSKPAPPLQSVAARAEPQPLRFHVEADKRGQVHIQCIQGKELLGSIGLSVAGISSLVNQGLMRKPASLKVGALHDWIELDGVLCSFEKGHNEAAKLEQVLNERYVPAATLGQGKDVVIFANAASSTGFDIQFPVTQGGTCERRRRHLAEDALEVLQDPERCGLLQPGRIVKLTRPCLIFKEKTADGGERYLEKRPENVVIIIGDDAKQKAIDLSQPVNYMHLSAVELTAVFNHPVINRHSKLLPDAEVNEAVLTDPQVEPKSIPASVSLPEAIEQKRLPAVELAKPQEEERIQKEPGPVEVCEPVTEVKKIETAPDERRPEPPNGWLKSIMAQEPMSHDWLTSLVYTRLARQFGNSREGNLGASPCWAIALGQTKHIEEPSFKGIFLTQKRGLGFLNAGNLARFNKGVAFIGTQDAAIEGIGVSLIGVGLDAQQRIVFIVRDGYRAKFGLPEPHVAATLNRLKEQGAVIAGVQEMLESDEALEVVWTVPAQQPNPNEPQVIETVRPAAAGADQGASQNSN